VRTKICTVLAILALVFAATLVVAAVPSGEARAEPREGGVTACAWFFDFWYKRWCGVECGFPDGTNVWHDEWFEQEWCYYLPIPPTGPEWFPNHVYRYRSSWRCLYCQQYP